MIFLSTVFFEPCSTYGVVELSRVRHCTCDYIKHVSCLAWCTMGAHRIGIGCREQLRRIPLQAAQVSSGHPLASEDYEYGSIQQRSKNKDRAQANGAQSIGNCIAGSITLYAVRECEKEENGRYYSYTSSPPSTTALTLKKFLY